MLNKIFIGTQILPKQTMKKSIYLNEKSSENIWTYPFTRSVENQIDEGLCDMNKDMPLSTYIWVNRLK
jgi:hypothetical protein